MFTALLLLVSLQSVAVSVAVRDADPVTLTGAQSAGLTGNAPGSIVAFAWDVSPGAWRQVPVQIDERKVVPVNVPYNGTQSATFPIPVYCDPLTWTGADTDPTFDADDELTVMAADAGEAASVGTPYPAGTLPGSGRQVTITDPVTAAVSFAYLFVQDGSLSPAAGRSDVAYTFSLLSGNYKTTYKLSKGPNPENSSVATAFYRVHFADRWITDELKVSAGAATNVDILDRVMPRAAPGDGTRTENTFASGTGCFIANRAGPIRAIRSYMGANSGRYAQQDHIAYARRLDFVMISRVHPIPSAWNGWDYAPAASGMTYRDDFNQGGLTINGSPDAWTAGKITWQMVTGPQGTLTHVFLFDTDWTGLNWTSWYEDNTRPTKKQYTGDGQAWGQSGPLVNVQIPNTDPSLGAAYRLVTTRVVYIDAPGKTTADALNRRAQATSPLQAAVMAWQ